MEGESVMRDIQTIENEIEKLVKRYERVQKRNHGDCAESKRIEGEIDNLEIELRKIKAQ